ncbi:excinuclease ABC subunit UvrC [Candidatus Anaplasma sp. TIGMIC]|uniref:excinuclease ABC subunit UvrC n=1 Tax=Candidatus Anaplasma sp. TIGMIC TaxID=3020713 RepID=UPI00232FF350|nr:excinuclease ABC subunit UvrC [Candidatus Anaplasma sp. TIGMIC]MDB1135605.1 excinuclease ABC subunit UvrC [Candidatus Anaplasma sp. TIGMIC]
MIDSGEHLHSAHRAIKEAISSVKGSVAGIYKMLGAEDRVLYIGKAKDLKNRLRSYLSPSRLSSRVKIMVMQIAKLDLVVTENETEALLLEAKLIKSLKPKYNIIMRDDKFYPYVSFSEHKYPRIFLRREKQKEIITGKSYGPFLSAAMTKHIISVIKKAFLIRSCKDHFFVTRDRPCIEYEMQNCSAPCVGKISEEDYATSVHMAHKVLIGKSKDIQRELFDEMCRFSSNLEYENAILYRNRLQALKSMQECMAFQMCMREEADFVAVYSRQDLHCVQIVSFRNGVNCGSPAYFVESSVHDSAADVVSMFVLQMHEEFRGVVYVDLGPGNDLKILSTALQKITSRKVEVRSPKSREEIIAMGMARNYAMEALNHRAHNAELLLELGELASFFGLNKVPRRVEVYDNSHISGAHPYGVMIVCGEQGLLKQEYRKFRIKTVDNGDDYSMMNEVMSRRFSEITTEIPDFVLIDGGRGHITAVREKLTNMGITFACIAKGNNRIPGTEVFYLSNGKKLYLDPHSRLMRFLCRLRDEAHRFAITAHRRSRDRDVRSSECISGTSGVGKTKLKALLAYFGSAQTVRGARTEEISKVPGIGPKLAERIVKNMRDLGN